MAHAQLSPSGWARWSSCPGSVRACQDLPDSTSPYADEGTAAHDVLERTLNARYAVFGDVAFSPSTFLGERVNVANEGEEPRLVTVDQEMVEHVETVAAYVEAKRQTMAAASHKGTAPVLVVPERRVSPEWAIGSPDCNGTADVILISDAEIEVIDLKYGKGVLVEPGTPEEPNGQLMLYLLGALGEWRLQPGQTCRVTIAQPRAAHPDGPIRSLAGIDEEAVGWFATRAKLAVQAVEQVPDLRLASEHGCRWCKAKPTCRAFSQWSLDAIGAPTDTGKASFLDDVTAFATGSPADLDPEELVRVLRSADLFRGYLSAVEDWAHEHLTKGTAPAALAAAYKLVNGRSQRRWMDANDDSIASALTKIRWKDPATEKTTGLGKKDIYTEALKSPTQIEGLLKAAAKQGGFTSTHWEAFNRLVVKPEGKLQMAPITDSRPAAGTKDPEVLFTGPAPVAPLIHNPFAI